MQPSRSRRALRRGRVVCCLLWLACSAPDLGNTLFSCETTDDCAPWQECTEYGGTFVCQRRLGASGTCPAGDCGEGVAGEAAALPAAEMSTAGADGCGAVDCSAPVVSQQTPQALQPVPWLADAGSSPAADTPAASPDAAATPAPTAALDAGEPAPVPAAPLLRFDFETDLEGWRSVPDQLPDDTLDGTEQSTELAHHGTGALRMVFDGEYTPVPGVESSSDAFYGAYQLGAPPAGAQVSLWMFSTAPDVSVEIYALASPDDTWTTLALAPLPPDEWQELRMTLPLVDSRQFGVLVHSPLDLAGFVYLDEISW